MSTPPAAGHRLSGGVLTGVSEASTVDVGDDGFSLCPDDCGV